MSHLGDSLLNVAFTFVCHVLPRPWMVSRFGEGPLPLGRALFAGLSFVVGALAATGCSPDPALGPDAPPIARVWASRCGACHTPVEPGTRTRSHIEDALGRHHARVALSDDEWSEMRDFLARPEAADAKTR